MVKCFISYRRQRPWVARLVNQELRAHKYETFFDIDGIEPGTRFPQIIESSLKQSDVVFVTIDTEWLIEKDGQRRLNSTEDWVRREIELALRFELPIIPLLVDSANVPKQEDLPESLRILTEYQGVRLRNTEFKTDLGKILAEVERLVEEQQAAQKIL